MVRLYEPSVDEDPHRRVTPLNEYLRFIVNQRSGREQILHLEFLEDSEERLLDTPRIHIGREVAHRDTGAHKQEVERLVIDDTDDGFARMIRHFVTCMYLHINYFIFTDFIFFI